MPLELPDVAKTLKSWPSRNLEQLVDDLSVLGGRFRLGDAVRLPRVTIWLRSGQTLAGRVLELHHDRNGTRTLLLQTTAQDTVDVAHIPWSVIEAVTVHDVEAIDRPPEPQKSVTREQLSQRVANVSEALAQKVGTPIDIEMFPSSDAELEPLSWLLTMAEEVLLDVVHDQRIAASLRGRVKKIRLGTGIAGTLVFADGILSFSTPIAWNKRTSRESLRRELEAML
jgi:hypothetical protein